MTRPLPPDASTRTETAAAADPTAAVTVRPATSADYACVARLTVAAYRDDGQVDAGHPYEHELTSVADRAAAGALLVAERAGQGVAGAVLFVLPQSAYAEISRPGEGEFRMLAVAPEAQGAGVGAALVTACLQRAVAHRCQTMVLCTREVATAAQRLYTRLGFVRMPERDWRPRPEFLLLAMRRPLPSAEAPPTCAPTRATPPPVPRTTGGAATPGDAEQ